MLTPAGLMPSSVHHLQHGFDQGDEMACANLFIHKHFLTSLTCLPLSWS